MDPHVIESADSPEATQPTGSARDVSVRAVLPDGAMGSGARVEVWPLDSLVAAPSRRATTDARGEATLRVGPGRWSVVVRRGERSFQREIREGDSIVDTLRPLGSLVGILPAAAGKTVSIAAVGVRATCEPSGFFRLDSLPSGALPLALRLPSGARAQVPIGAGRPTLMLGSTDGRDSVFPGLPVDSLVPWLDQSPPIRLPRRALGFSGDFALAVRFRRVDTRTPIQVFNWTDGAMQGLKVAWRGADTLFLTVDGRTLVGIGMPLDTGSRQVGIAWEGGTFRLVVDARPMLSFSYSTAQARGEWSTPMIGIQGMERLDWIAFQRDSITTDWLERLSGM